MRSQYTLLIAGSSLSFRRVHLARTLSVADLNY